LIGAICLEVKTPELPYRLADKEQVDLIASGGGRISLSDSFAGHHAPGLGEGPAGLKATGHGLSSARTQLTIPLSGETVKNTVSKNLSFGGEHVALTVLL
jgi:hypothetical protein